MKIALIGYGKMGKAIEEIAVAKGHQIVLKITSRNIHDFNSENLKKADVCIEFSTPHTAFENVKKCLESGVPTVCGSTAWLDRLSDVQDLANQHQTGFLFASNFSIGVNLFFYINERVADLMKNYPEYKVGMEEIHHTAKKDAPSGTAVTLAEGIIKQNAHIKHWVNTASEDPSILGIVSKRIDPAPGTHTITYSSTVDDITINHTAHNRIGFASGAVLAAEFLKGKKGIFSMQEVLGI